MSTSESSNHDMGDDKPPEAGRKIQRTVQSMLKQMEISNEERKYRMENFDNVDIGKEHLKNLKCTKCNMNFQQIINKGESVGIHPLLGVLMCDSCCDFYGDGNFSLDSEGEDKYCRWCGEGGTIFACTKCICGFCSACIEKHFGVDGLEGVKNDDDWVCFFCNNKPLWYLRSICFLANKAAKNKLEQLKKKKESRIMKRKRRKKENSEEDTNNSSLDSNSSESSNSSNKNSIRRKRLLRQKESVKRDESSSNADEKENHIDFKRKLVKSKKQNADKEISSENDSKNSKKKSKMTCDESRNVFFESKKVLVLEKLKSIWKLTQTITEVGLNTSRERLKSLSKSDNFKTLDRLKKEHEELKSCMNILVSSLNTASNSVNSIKEDLTFDDAKDEREIFQIQETKLNRIAKKYQEESNIETSVDSDEDSAQKEIKMKKKEMRLNSIRDLEKVKRKKRESDVSLEKKSKKGNNKLMSLFSDSCSEKEKEKENAENNLGKLNENKENRESSNENDLVMPLLKVKSFARMLDENVYDKDKTVISKNGNNPVVIDLYNIDTDESENENQRIRDSLEDNSGSVNVKISNTEENKSCENVREVQENSTNNQDEKNELFSEKSEERKSLCERKKNRSYFSMSELQVRKFEKINKSVMIESDESDGRKKKNSFYKTKKKKKKKKVKKILSYVESEKSTVSSEDENYKNKLSEYESEEERKDSDGDKNKRKHLLILENIEKIESSEQENENKDSTSDKEEEEVNKKKKKCSSNNKSKKSFGDNNANSTGHEDEEEEKKNSSDDESMKKKNLSEDSMSIDKKELFDRKKASEQEKMSLGKSIMKIEKQDSSDGGGKKSFSGEQKSTRNSRNKKKVRDILKTSFEEYKRKRERFLSSKERWKPRNNGVENRVTKVLESSESESEQKKKEQKIEKPRKKRILASSDEEYGKGTTEIKSSDVEESEEESRNKKFDSKMMKQSSDEMSSNDEIKNKTVFYGDKKRTRIIKLKRKRKSVSSDTDSSEDETKKHRKKGKENSSESSEDADKRQKKGRKNIKKILKKDSLQVETKQALKNEEERKKRLKERQKLFEELFPKEKEENDSKQIILDFDPVTKEPLVKVHKKLAKKLKPHQVEGVKFMWDNCFESVQKLEEESGSGCILAHCMGLGKTLQVITLVHTVMTHDLGVNTVLIVCPLSTVSNWIREFEMWLENVRTDPITLYNLVRYKKIDERRFHLEDWYQNGGVLVLSYDLFRTLTKRVLAKKYKKNKAKYTQVFEKVLLDPGPDLVICDEGHLLKNEDTVLSKSVGRIKTSRRIVLTGTPLQNNLIEYHCMVQFVKPNILGTKKEFCNRFVNPIKNGQFEDSTELDVKIMKKRSHVLHSMLDGCIQRFDYSVLTPFLAEKYEYVLSISLTEVQAKAYQHFINNLSAKSSGSSKAATLFNDYNNLQRIWTHPRTILMQSERESQKEALEDESEGSLKDFIVSSDEETCKSESENSDSSIQEVVSKKRILRSNANDPEMKKAIEEEEKLQEKHWWNEFYDEKAYEDIRESNKLVVLFSLLKYCREAQDKVLVFSQSLYSLDLIEYFLNKIDENVKKNDETLCGHQDTWVLGSDYFRLDGSTKCESRAIWCKYFNQESNTRARLFLISTKAGGLGINLFGANRVVLFDASWNPSHDLQSIFRVYRFGQKKTCYIYRFLAEATMEEKIYERQVTKLSLAHRVVDEFQIERHYTMGNLLELYTFEPTPKDQRKVPKFPKDSVLADLLGDHKDIIVGYHEHDSLLENKQEEELTEEERKAAWKEYEEEKVQKTYSIDGAMQQAMMLMQQAQFSQGGVGAEAINPISWSQMNAGQNFINPMFFSPNIPFDVLQRGMRVGVTPLPNESLESYFKRILNRENWMLTKQTQ